MIEMQLARDAESTPVAASVPYASGLELIRDLLARLDKRLSALVGDFQATRGWSEGHALRGLVITDAEAGDLLAAGGRRRFSHADEGLWAQIEPRVEATRGTNVVLPLDVVRERFRLSSFDVDCLLMCFAVEVDTRYQKIFGYLNDDLTRKYPTTQLLLEVLSGGDMSGRRRRHLLPSGQLLRSRLLVSEDGETQSQLGRCLRVEPAVVQFLLGDFQANADLQPIWLDREFPELVEELWKDGHVRVIEAVLRSHFETPASKRLRLVVPLTARRGSGRRHAVETACSRHGLGLLPIDCRRLLRQQQPDVFLAKAFRDSLLHGAPVLLGHFEAVLEDRERGPDVRLALERNVEEHGWIVFLSLDPEWTLPEWFSRQRLAEIKFDELNQAERRANWVALLTKHTGLASDAACSVADALAAKFRLTSGQMALVFQRGSQGLAKASPVEEWSNALHRHAALVSAPRLGELAQKLKPIHRWDHLVLPVRQIEQIQFIAQNVQYRRKVMEEWRFETLRSRGSGLAILFSGPPGTGKTMAAEVVANELQMDLYRIDLANVVSKYIGETEKNLARIFHEAERSDAILFFDEADALFGKRSEVKDAHDRYANIEINYLLQRIESYEGVAILATNLRHHLDDAFLRRIQIVVEFPMPTVEDRRRIWQQSFPPEAPLASDIDFHFMAKNFDFAGGSVANVSLGAALLAAEQGGPINMEHIIRATRRELEKVGKRTVREEFGPYSNFLDRGDLSAAAR